MGGRHRGAVRPNLGIRGELAATHSTYGAAGGGLDAAARINGAVRSQPCSAPSGRPNRSPERCTLSARRRCCSTPAPALQSSQLQLWVVRMSGGGALRSFAVRAATTGAGAMPSEETERSIAM